MLIDSCLTGVKDHPGIVMLCLAVHAATVVVLAPDVDASGLPQSVATAAAMQAPAENVQSVHHPLHLHLHPRLQIEVSLAAVCK